MDIYNDQNKNPEIKEITNSTIQYAIVPIYLPRFNFTEIVEKYYQKVEESLNGKHELQTYIQLFDNPLIGYEIEESELHMLIRFFNRREITFIVCSNFGKNIIEFLEYSKNKLYFYDGVRFFEFNGLEQMWRNLDDAMFSKYEINLYE